ncbi:MAG: hypothetical protein MHPSP_001103 [Paramarteilia canceri]
MTYGKKSFNSESKETIEGEYSAQPNFNIKEVFDLLDNTKDFIHNEIIEDALVSSMNTITQIIDNWNDEYCFMLINRRFLTELSNVYMNYYLKNILNYSQSLEIMDDSSSNFSTLNSMDNLSISNNTYSTLSSKSLKKKTSRSDTLRNIFKIKKNTKVNLDNSSKISHLAEMLLNLIYALMKKSPNMIIKISTTFNIVKCLVISLKFMDIGYKITAYQILSNMCLSTENSRMNVANSFIAVQQLTNDFPLMSNLINDLNSALDIKNESLLLSIVQFCNIFVNSGKNLKLRIYLQQVFEVLEINTRMNNLAALYSKSNMGINAKKYLKNVIDGQALLNTISKSYYIEELLVEEKKKQIEIKESFNMNQKKNIKEAANVQREKDLATSKLYFRFYSKSILFYFRNQVVKGVIDIISSKDQEGNLHSKLESLLAQLSIQDSNDSKITNDIDLKNLFNNFKSKSSLDVPNVSTDTTDMVKTKPILQDEPKPKVDSTKPKSKKKVIKKKKGIKLPDSLQNMKIIHPNNKLCFLKLAKGNPTTYDQTIYENVKYDAVVKNLNNEEFEEYFKIQNSKHKISAVANSDDLKESSKHKKPSLIPDKRLKEIGICIVSFGKSSKKLINTVETVILNIYLII